MYLHTIPAYVYYIRHVPTGIPSWNKGIPTPEHVIQLIKEKTTGIPKSEEWKRKVSKPKCDSHSANVSRAALKRPKFPCEVCGRMVTKANIINHRNSHNE